MNDKDRRDARDKILQMVESHGYGHLSRVTGLNKGLLWYIANGERGASEYVYTIVMGHSPPRSEPYRLYPPRDAKKMAKYLRERMSVDEIVSLIDELIKPSGD